MSAEKCMYCGRFMRRVDDEGWDMEPRCTQVNAHILADPERWSIYVENLDRGEDALFTGYIGAHHLTREQLSAVMAERASDGSEPAS
jgi:hypothetical protein